MSKAAAAAEVKERPILFSGPMVRAILEKRKSQTRRVLQPQPTEEDGWYWWPQKTDIENGITSKVMWNQAAMSGGLKTLATFCRYGKPGDRLWVREMTTEYKFRNQKPRTVYAADGELHGHKGWTPSIYMPRALSRITLEITGVKVERLQEISEADARAEGVTPLPNQKMMSSIGYEHLAGYRQGFAIGWDNLNAKRGYSWESNPWVWCLSFRPIETKINT